MTSLDLPVLLVLALWFLFSGFPFSFALLQSPGETKGQTASLGRRVQVSSRQSLSFSVSNCVFLENSGCFYLSSLFHVTFYILCKKKFTVQKRKKQNKKTKKTWNPVCSEVLRENSTRVSLLKLTELHRTQKFTWLRPWNSSNQRFLSLSLSRKV